MSDPNCNHLKLKKCIVGESLFYKCEQCSQNFRVPEPLVINVTYPKAGDPPKEGKL